MPRGVYKRKTIACRKCPGSKFKNLSELRSHQWAQHPETYARTGKVLRSPASRKKRIEGLRRHYAELKQVALVPLEQSLNGDMRVSDLLGELKNQQKFMNDVVSLVSGILSTHQEAQKRMTRKETR